MVKKRVPKLKTGEERRTWVGNLKEQMSETWGLSRRTPGIDKLFEILDAFADSGEGSSGSIPFPDDPYGRKIRYILSNRKHITCSVAIAK